MARMKTLGLRNHKVSHELQEVSVFLADGGFIDLKL